MSTSGYEHSPAFDSGHLARGKAHQIYYEQYGKADGKPVIFLHGGPGGHTSKANTVFFNPEIYRVVLLDQRGCGKSKPHVGLQDNTPQHLVADIEALREHLQVDQWHVVFGGSWGSALALLYAQAHPKSVKTLVLRGIFTARKSELEFATGFDGAARIFPAEFNQFISHLAPEDRKDHIKAYYKQLTSEDHRTRIDAAREWNRWELTISSLKSASEQYTKLEDEAWSIAHATIEAHYSVNNFWLEDNQVLKQQNVDTIRHIPSEPHDMESNLRS